METLFGLSDRLKAASNSGDESLARELRASVKSIQVRWFRGPTSNPESFMSPVSSSRAGRTKEPGRRSEQVGIAAIAALKEAAVASGDYGEAARHRDSFRAQVCRKSADELPHTKLVEEISTRLQDALRRQEFELAAALRDAIAATGGNKATTPTANSVHSEPAANAGEREEGEEIPVGICSTMFRPGEVSARPAHRPPSRAVGATKRECRRRKSSQLGSDTTSRQVLRMCCCFSTTLQTRPAPLLTPALTSSFITSAAASPRPSHRAPGSHGCRPYLFGFAGILFCRKPRCQRPRQDG